MRVYFTRIEILSSRLRDLNSITSTIFPTDFPELNHALDQLRGAGNLLVSSLRGLEIRIRVDNPMFELMSRLWFE